MTVKPGGGNATSGVIRKTADETVNNSTVIQDDNALSFPIAANQTVVATFVILYSAAPAADLAAQVTTPVGAAGSVGIDALGPSATSTDGSVTRGVSGLNATNRFGGVGVGTKCEAKLSAVIRNGATAGNVTLQWAQFVADLSDAVVYADSYVIWTLDPS